MEIIGEMEAKLTSTSSELKNKEGGCSVLEQELKELKASSSEERSKFRKELTSLKLLYSSSASRLK